MAQNLQQKSLKTDLVSAFESGDFFDIEFLVGPNATSVKAHKLILRARSPIFVTMLDKQWESEDGIIKLPNHREETFKAFIKFIYYDELKDAPNDLDDLIEMLELGAMYELQLLIKQATSLVEKIMQNDAYMSLKVYNRLQNLAPSLATKAFKIVKRNVAHLTKTSNGNDFSFDTLKTILSSEEMDIEEIDLFKAVEKWVGEDKERRKDAKVQLIPLIRFPLMTMKDIADFVLPSRLLSKDKIANLFIFFSQERSRLSLSDMIFKFRSRRPKLAENSEQLVTYLEYAKPGDVVQLVGGQSYSGLRFFLKKDQHFITLEGVGEPLPIVTSDSFFGLEVYGNCCYVSNIKITNNPYNGVFASGFGHILENLKIESSKNGVNLTKAKTIKLKSIVLEKVQRYVEYFRNEKNFEMTPDDSDFKGVDLICSKNIELSNVTAITDCKRQKDYFAYIDKHCLNIKFTGSESEMPIRVDRKNLKVSTECIVLGSGSSVTPDLSDYDYDEDEDEDYPFPQTSKFFEYDYDKDDYNNYDDTYCDKTYGGWGCDPKD